MWFKMPRMIFDCFSTSRSLTNSIAKALFLIIMLSVATTGFAIITLSSCLNDAAVVNVSGSLRMQSYRLSHDIQSNSTSYIAHIQQFESSLYSPSMKALQRWFVPKDITYDYYDLITRWHELKRVLLGSDRTHYVTLVAGFVKKIDNFVFKLQRHSELKLIALAWVGGIGLSGIFVVSFFVINYIRKKVVTPLHALMEASQQIQHRDFDVNIVCNSSNEMSILSCTFNQMAADLGKLYRGLEKAVDEKTRRLQHANRSLNLLYESSQELAVTRLTLDSFNAIVNHITKIEGIVAVKLEIVEAEERPIIITAGEIITQEWHKQALVIDEQVLGHLYWQVGLPCPDQALIDNFVYILARALFYNQAQKQAEQLLLMEERATIARELHDSLAQSLSYLKIQVTLLKRVITKLREDANDNQTDDIVNDIDIGLSGAYIQLRELLSTFRLSLKEGSFGQALKEMIAQLNEQTELTITLDNQLASLELDSHEQIHLLQLIREATINAIKHACAQYVHILCIEEQGVVTVTVTDDGVGFDSSQSKLNHYGLEIMQERAARLNGELTVNSIPNESCEVKLTYTRRS